MQQSLSSCHSGIQDMMSHEPHETDASGNPVLGDIGVFLGRSIKAYFKARNNKIDLKYIDPTYMIRAIPTIPSDHIYCNVLGQNSVHAAFAGFTGALPTCMIFRVHCFCGITVVQCLWASNQRDLPGLWP